MIEARKSFYSALGQLVRLIELKLEKKQLEDINRYIDKIDETFDSVFKIASRSKQKFLLTLFDQGFFLQHIQNNPQFTKVNDPYALVNLNYFPGAFYLNDFYSNIYFEVWNLTRDKYANHAIRVIGSVVQKIIVLNSKGYHSSSLQAFLQVIRKSNELNVKNAEEKSIQLYLSSHRWYLQIAFFSEKFNTDHLVLIDQFLLITVRTTIDNNKLECFKDLISSCIQEYRVVPSLPPTVPFNFFKNGGGHEVSVSDKLEDDAHRLIFKYRLIRNQQSYGGWLLEFEQFDKLITSRPEATMALLSELRKFGRQLFLYNNLKERVFVLGVYCVFRERYSFLNYLITANQPLDSEASFTNQDINPIHFDDIYYFLSIRYKLEQESFAIWEGHHGFMYYLEQYIIVLIASSMRLASRMGQNTLDEEFEIFLQQAKTLQSLRSLSSSWAELNRPNAKTESVLVELGFSREFITNKLKVFIQKVAKRTDKKIRRFLEQQQPDKSKVARFILNNLKSYSGSAHLRQILNFKKNLEINHNLPAPNGSKINLYSSVDPIKNGLIEPPDMPYIGLDSYGKALADIDNNNVFTFLYDASVHSGQIGFDQVLLWLNQKVTDSGFIILMRNIHFLSDIIGEGNIVNSWDLPEKHPLRKINCFHGLFQNKNEVYSFSDVYSNQKTLLVLKRSAIQHIDNFPVPKQILKYKRNNHHIGYSLKFLINDSVALDHYAERWPGKRQTLKLSAEIKFGSSFQITIAAGSIIESAIIR